MVDGFQGTYTLSTKVLISAYFRVSDSIYGVFCCFSALSVCQAVAYRYHVFLFATKIIN